MMALRQTNRILFFVRHVVHVWPVHWKIFVIIYLTTCLCCLSILDLSHELDMSISGSKIPSGSTKFQWLGKYDLTMPNLRVAQTWI